MIARRAFLTGGLALVAAPALVRFESLMPVKAMPPAEELDLLSHHYEWMRDGQLIADWHGNGYVLQPGDVDKEIVVRVTAEWGHP